MQSPGLTAEQKALVLHVVMSRPAYSGLEFGYRWKPDKSWYPRQVAKSNNRREMERLAVANARSAALQEAAA